MQRQLEWDDLRIFLAVAQAGSLGSAARILQVHRSTVLRRIEKLEGFLSSRLFDRTSEGVTLTVSGERLIPHAELMADETRHVLRLADTDHGRPAGTIRVAATFNLAFALLPPLLAEFRQACPEISVDVSATVDGYSPIHPDRFDIGFRTLEPGAQDNQDMIGRRLGQLPIAIYGSKSYFKSLPVPRSGSELTQHRLLGADGALSNISAMRWFANQAGNTRPVYRANSMLLLYAAVSNGLGLACLPRYLGARHGDLVRAFDLPQSCAADLWILRHPHHRHTARMKVFADFMSAEIPKLLKPGGVSESSD